MRIFSSQRHVQSLRRNHACRRAYGAAAIAIAFASVSAPAIAQTGDAAASDDGVIVVTAQRREELAREVPVTITSLNESQLKEANVDSLLSLPKLSPGVRFDQQGSYTQPVIRGIGNTIALTQAGNSVGVYVDGFYVPNSLSLDFDFLNVEGIQVLKGPQGTLFGRNSTGGAILVTTAEPEFTTKGIVEASYERFDAKKLQGYVTAPLTNSVAVSLEGLYSSGDGFHREVFAGPYAPGFDARNPGAYEKWTVRAAVKADFGDTASVILRYQHSDKQDPTGDMNGTWFGEIGGFTYPFTAGDTVPGTVFASGPRDIALNQLADFRVKSDIVQLTAKFDLGSADLTSYSQYREDDIEHLLDSDFSSASLLALSLPEKDKVVTQELLLNSKAGGRLQYTAGLFFFAGQSDNQIILSLGGSPYFQLSGNGAKTRTYAAYGDVTYEVVDDVFLTGGLRYSHDEVKDAYGIAGGVRIFAPDYNSDRLSPRVVLRYKPSENSSIYASFNRGYKSAFATPLKENRTNYKGKFYIQPEDLNAFEIGYKYADADLSIDLAGFYYDYRHLQNSYYELGSAVYSSADKVRIKGLEGAIRYQLTPQFEVSAAATYLDAQYVRYETAGFFTPVILPDTDGDGVPDFAGFNTATQADVSGLSMARAPKFSGTFAARYKTELAGGELALSANLYHSSRVYFDPAHQFSQGSYDIVAARIQWTDPSDVFTLAVFGDNLFDEKYVTQANVGLVGAGTVWGKPATYGISVRAKFGS